MSALGPKDYYYWITASALLAGVVGWVYAGMQTCRYALLDISFMLM